MSVSPFLSLYWLAVFFWSLPSFTECEASFSSSKTRRSPQRYCVQSNRKQPRLLSVASSTSTTALFSSQLSSDPNQARKLVFQGMEAFRKGNVNESIDLFDKADALRPDGSLHPYLWQRGLSLYYADRFQEASDQFRADVAVNPNDVEEIVWDIASLLRIQPDDFPPPNRMSLPPGRQDRRRIMVRIRDVGWVLIRKQSMSNTKENI